jgi:hypothetical protein
MLIPTLQEDRDQFTSFVIVSRLAFNCHVKEPHCAYKLITQMLSLRVRRFSRSSLVSLTVTINQAHSRLGKTRHLAHKPPLLARLGTLIMYSSKLSLRAILLKPLCL